MKEFDPYMKKLILIGKVLAVLNIVLFVITGNSHNLIAAIIAAGSMWVADGEW